MPDTERKVVIVLEEYKGSPAERYLAALRKIASLPKWCNSAADAANWAVEIAKEAISPMLRCNK